MSSTCEPLIFVTLTGEKRTQIMEPAVINREKQGGAGGGSFLSPELYIGEVLWKTCSKYDFRRALVNAWLFIAVVWAGASAGTSTDDNFAGSEEQLFFALSSCDLYF